MLAPSKSCIRQSSYHLWKLYHQNWYQMIWMHLEMSDSNLSDGASPCGTIPWSLQLCHITTGKSLRLAQQGLLLNNLAFLYGKSYLLLVLQLLRNCKIGQSLPFLSYSNPSDWISSRVSANWLPKVILSLSGILQSWASYHHRCRSPWKL